MSVARILLCALFVVLLPQVAVAVPDEIGGSPVIEVDANPLDFGVLEVGEVVDRPLIVSNAGAPGTVFTITDLVLEGSSDYSFPPAQPPLPIEVEGQASVALFIRSAPSAPGPIDGTLSIVADGATNSPLVVSLQTTAIELVCDNGGPYAGQPLTPIEFDGSASSSAGGTIETYIWAFGDGSSDSGPIRSHAYNATGTYTVTLCVTDTGGAIACCETEAVIAIDPAFESNMVVTPDPIDFGNVAPGAMPLTTVAITNEGQPGSILEVTSVALSDPTLVFDPAPVLPIYLAADGSSSAELSIRLVDPQSGPQSETLTLLSSANNSPVTVPITYTGNVPPGCVAGGPYTGVVGEAVQFDGSASTDPVGIIVAWDWEFGDGSIGSGPMPTHTYAQSAVFDVTLCVTNDADIVTCCTTTAAIGPSSSLTPIVQVTPDPIDFGEVPLEIPQFLLVEVTNEGDIGSLLEVTGALLSGPGLVFEPEPTLPFVVPADGSSSVTLSIRLDPEAGPQSGFLTLVSNAANSPLDVPIAYVGNVRPICDAGGPYVTATGLPVTFDGSASEDPDGTIVEYTWEFGDGGIGDGPMPTHTYALAGVYDVTLCVKGDFDIVTCCETTAVVQASTALTPVLQVVPDEIDFGVAPANSNLFETVVLSNKGDVGSVLVVTDLVASGAGTSIETAPQVPFFLFQGGPSVDVLIRHVVGSGSNTGNLLIVSNAANSPFNVPISSFGNGSPQCDAGGPYSGVIGAPVAFDGSGSVDATGVIVSWNWSFGDGATASGEMVEHTYVTDGLYSVELCVIDEFGAESCCVAVATIEGLDCDTGGPYTGIQGASVSFDGSGSSSPNGAITDYAWDFGDGGTATGVAPTHVYLDSGTFQVQLTVTDVTGVSDDCSTTATIDGIDCDAGPVRNGSIGDPLTFDGSGSSSANGPIVSYDWDFGDGSTATGATVVHSYAANGLYTVTLCLVDSGGFSTCCTTQANIQPQGLPTCDAGGPYVATIGTAVTLDGTGSSDPGGDIASYAWEFGDGETGSGPMPSHTYFARATYQVTLCVTDADGNEACCNTVVTIPDASTDFPTLPLHAVQVPDAPCAIPDPCPLPTVQVDPVVPCTVYLLAQSPFTVGDLNGVQTAFDFGGWTLLSQAWDCQSNQLNVREPADPGGATDGTLTTAFDCVTGSGTAIIGRMFLVSGASGTCLTQTDSSFPFGTHLVGCDGTALPVVSRGSVCAGVMGQRACGFAATGVEPTTWGSIKSQFLTPLRRPASQPERAKE